MSEQNPDLLATAQALDDLRGRLQAAKAAETDPDKYAAINDQLIELHHRVAAVDGLIFSQASQAISDAAAKIATAKVEVDAEIAKIDSIAHFIGTISAFLGLVDKVIAVATAL
jgi:hypothetical protein